MSKKLVSITMYLISKFHNHKLQTNPRHREEEPQNNNKTSRRRSKHGKATSSVFPIKMIAKLERTQSNTQQNMEQTQNTTMGATINKESTTTKPPPYLERTAA